MAAENTLAWFNVSAAALNPNTSFPAVNTCDPIRGFATTSAYLGASFCFNDILLPPQFCPQTSFSQPPPTGTGVISGTVLETGNPVARIVRAYRRSDGIFLAQTTSLALDGSFSFSSLPNSTECFIVAFDDTGSVPDYNALIFDRIVTN